MLSGELWSSQLADDGHDEEEARDDQRRAGSLKAAQRFLSHFWISCWKLRGAAVTGF